MTPAVFYILLALAKEEKHGYEIMKDVNRTAQGKIKMGNGTLYGCIKRMLADGLIEDAGERVQEDDTRRKYYRLTAEGRRALNSEIKRYVETVEVIRANALLADALTMEGQA